MVWYYPSRKTLNQNNQISIIYSLRILRLTALITENNLYNTTSDIWIISPYLLSKLCTTLRITAYMATTFYFATIYPTCIPFTEDS